MGENGSRGIGDSGEGVLNWSIAVFLLVSLFRLCDV